MKEVLLRLLCFAGVLFVFWGCTHEPWMPAAGPAPPNGDECDTAHVSFKRDIIPLMQQHCYTCHTGMMASGNIFLDNYDGVKKIADDGSLAGSVKGEPGYQFMPEAAPPLNDCEIRKITAWIALGSPDN